MTSDRTDASTIGGRPAVEVHDLTKFYGRVPALRGLDLRVTRGSVFSLLGPNGAGKTTMVRVLATLTKPDGGSAEVAGFDVVKQRRQVRQRISLTGQYAAVDGMQTGEENLVMMARLRGQRRSTARTTAGELLERFDLTDAGRRLVKTYSGGMRRRLDLAASLIGQPRVVFLDEPTTGLDPRSRQAAWEMVANLAASGVTIFLTTQYLEEADQLADHVAVIDEGRIVADGSPADLKQRVAQQRLDLVLADAASYAELAEKLDDRAVYTDPAHRVVGVATDGSAQHVRRLLDELDPDRSTVASFALHTATLDDVFLALTGHTTSTQPTTKPAAAGVESAHEPTTQDSRPEPKEASHV